MEVSRSAPFLGSLVEICIVTSDHKRTIEGLLRLGIGPFQVHNFTPSRVTSQKYYGQDTAFEIKVCFAKHGSLVWEIMQPVAGSSIIADYLAKHGDGIHHVAFDCDDMPVQKRQDEFLRRGFRIAQEGIWHGNTGTCHFTFFDTEGATCTCFESYQFSSDWEDPHDSVWYPAPPVQAPELDASKQSALIIKGTDANGVIPARKGKAIPLKKGQSIKITNTYGKQVIDFFAFSLDSNMRSPPPENVEYLSMQHTRAINLRTIPITGDLLYSNFRKPMLKFVEDTSPGVHDTLIPACDLERYRMLGVTEHHTSCSENMHMELAKARFPWPAYETPAPFNLFMNIPVRQGGNLSFEPPESKEGDYVTLQAEKNCLIVMSACPQDIIAVNAMKPMDCQYEIF